MCEASEIVRRSNTVCSGWHQGIVKHSRDESVLKRADGNSIVFHIFNVTGQDPVFRRCVHQIDGRVREGGLVAGAAHLLG